VAAADNCVIALPQGRRGNRPAAALGISLGTVKSTVSRAVAKLRIDAELGEDAGA